LTRAEDAQAKAQELRNQAREGGIEFDEQGKPRAQPEAMGALAERQYVSKLVDINHQVATRSHFIVFTFSSLLVAIQVASAQLTPRIIATTLLRDSTIRLVVALFVLTLSFALMTLARSQTEVQYLLMSCAVALGAASTVAFIYLIDYAARLLRPVSIVWRLGEPGDCRYCSQGPVTGDQRSYDGGAGDRPAASPAARRRPPSLARRCDEGSLPSQLPSIMPRAHSQRGSLSYF
jgi:hypothetical protein